uniref:Diguanylate cyclase domain-containing protein n=1 Tax=Desertifilum tharense IPPAS B-1220 TaxID=1781255 RepID=A0ACD5GU40_9CYAN
MSTSTCHEITDYKQSEAKLLHEALHDELTGLPNRTLFMERLKQAVEQNQRYARTAHKSYPFALLFLDLDRFKLINDSLGHLVGDQLLQMIARRLESAILPRNIGINGANDTVARLGGDEFAILLDRLHDRNEAIAIAERLHELFRSPFHLYGSPLAESETPSRTFHEVFTTVSIGITFPSPAPPNPKPSCEMPILPSTAPKPKAEGVTKSLTPPCTPAPSPFCNSKTICDGLYSVRNSKSTINPLLPSTRVGLPGLKP